ncbi:hypothetical protein WN55_11416 [Dufourea novaeangliae]|uniref:Uncharacterized protein n=1 Tax=Dufourea novaeangliae TaxID=178035 RepID=A0A154PAT1_DUFNO|nr:hypothetical protein WN55_11416 [Dufourea novaeangliae]
MAIKHSIISKSTFISKYGGGAMIQHEHSNCVRSEISRKVLFPITFRCVLTEATTRNYLLMSHVS